MLYEGCAVVANTSPDFNRNCSVGKFPVLLTPQVTLALSAADCSLYITSLVMLLFIVSVAKQKG